MCNTIAPDCGSGYGSGYGFRSRSDNTFYNAVNRDLQPKIHLEPATQAPNLNTLSTGESDNSRYDHIGRRRFFPDRNRSDNTWDSAGRGLSTENPVWPIPNFVGVTGQYPAMTDSGKLCLD